LLREPYANGKKVRVAVIGVGDFGRNHVRVFKEFDHVELIGVLDSNFARASEIAAEFSTSVVPSFASLTGRVDAVSIAVPTADHAQVGCALMEHKIDVLVEKPIAASLAEADQLIRAAKKNGRILQVGHLERFNPAVLAVEPILNHPLFFEVHRLGIFTSRSLDIDVVYDVMIHDLDILLALVGSSIEEVKAVGIPVLTDKVDIAHARIAFASGAVANVTASRVSTERVRKMRFFQQHEYISLDYTRRDALRVRVAGSPHPSPANQAMQPEFAFEKLPAEPVEPLQAELRDFVEAVRTRRAPRVDGAAGRRALDLADRVMAGIVEHARRVQLGAYAVPRAGS
jgi:predicted dehydrogenase